MSITTIPTRTSADPNSATDINTLMANDLALYASLGGGGGGGGSTQLIGFMRGNIYAMANTGYYYHQGEAKTFTRFAGKLGVVCTGTATLLGFYKGGSLTATLSIPANTLTAQNKTINATVGVDTIAEVRVVSTGVTGKDLSWNIKGA